MTLTESYKELLRRTELTCVARYKASSRLNYHGYFSQWTLALLSIGQIVIALIMALNFEVNFSERYVTFISIFFGVLVLAYSLLLGMGNHEARSIKLHQCGLELGELARKIYFFATGAKSSQKEYENFARKYYEILEKCENHSTVDYLAARLERNFPKKISDLNFLDYYSRVKDASKMWFFRLLQFSHYVISLVLIGAWIWKLIKF